MSKTVSVCLSFDFDALSIWLGPMRSSSPSTISRGEFGAVGTERLLHLLRRYQVSASWFIPGHTINTYPNLVQKIADTGHEIGHHGYLHENPVSVSPDQECRILERGIECIRRLTGQAPSGYRAPGWSLSPHSIPLLLKLGFQYDSSLMGNDFTPYYCRVGDEASVDRAYQFGQEVNLVELPVDWSLDDWPYFGLNWSDYHVGLRTPDEVYQIWAGDFDFLYQQMDTGVYILTMHPQIIGRGNRILMLERLIQYIKGHEGVTFKTMHQVATEWRQKNLLEKEKKAT
ncbi:MAG: polysaccharide deacetylase [Xenococcaceae cyanobacterium MO_188.B19]|nr:polysaccharide deacetylase [Xenococcaceae cyanobacterium MO_188.B19]